jgi:apolipoprotein N-acyltransferase
MKFLFLSLFAGLVAACGFEPFGLWPLTLVAFAGLMQLVARAPTLRNALARGWWFGMGYFALGLNWIATAFTYQAAMPAWLGWIAVVLLSCYIAVYPAAAVGLAWRYGRRTRLRLVLVLAAAWIVTEWLRATMFTGFAWNPAGVALLPTGASWLATWIGTYGLSGIALLLAGVLYLLNWRQWARAGVLCALIVAASLLARLASPAATPRAQPLPVRVVQPNIGQEDKWRVGFEEESLSRLKRLSEKQAPGPRLLLWPEAAITYPLQDGRADPVHQRDAAELRALVGRLIGPGDLLLTGGITLQSRDGVGVDSATNSVFAMNPEGRILARYDKAHLVPYGEYLPMRTILAPLGLSRLVAGDIDFAAGPGPRTRDVAGLGKVGVPICYEIKL